MSNTLAGAPVEKAAPAGDRRFSRFALAMLAFNILVILWGAFVRATGSGAGCGNHWPLCNGDVIARAPSIETIIEFTHRMTSGLSLIGTIGLCVWAYRLFPRGHRARVFATLAVVFLFTEALLGAGLVLLNYVGQNASAGRAAYLSAHLVNTLILLAMLEITAWFGAGRRSRILSAPKLALGALPAAALVAVSGAISALGDTLFPATSVASGMQQEFSSAASLVLRLRTLHPLLAVIVGLMILVAGAAVGNIGRPKAKRIGAFVSLLVFLQLAAGAVNIALLAPVWMQIVHLLFADLLWVGLVLMVLEAGAVIE